MDDKSGDDHTRIVMFTAGTTGFVCSS